MEWTDFLGPMFGAFATIIFLGIQQKEMRKPAEIGEDRKRILRQPGFYKYIGIAGMLFAFVMLFIFENDGGKESLLKNVGIFTFFFLPFGYLYLFGRNSWLKFDEHGIEHNSSFNKRTNIKWDKLTSIKYNMISQGIKFKSEREKFTLYQSVVGFKEFILELNQRGWSSEDMKIPANLFGDNPRKRKEK